METKMRKVSELKHLELTPEDEKSIETDFYTWAKSKFNEEDAVNGICTYFVHDETDKSVFIFARNGSFSILNDNVVEISDFTNGYCEVLSKDGKHLLCAGPLVPLELRKDLDRVYISPLEIQNISEDLLSKYLKAFEFVGTISLNEKFNELKNDRDASLGSSFLKLSQAMNLQEENSKYKQICASLEARFGREEQEEVDNEDEINDEQEKIAQVKAQPQPAPQSAPTPVVTPTTANLEELKSTLQKFVSTPTASTKKLDDKLVSELEESAAVCDELDIVQRTIVSYNKHFPEKSTQKLGISDFDIPAYSKRANRLSEDFSIYCGLTSQEETPENFNEYLQMLHAIAKSKNPTGSLTQERKDQVIRIMTETKQNIIENLNTKK